MSLKVGTFLCKVLAPVNGWFGEAGVDNTPYLRLPLRVIQDGPCEGEETEWPGWLTDKSLDRTVKTLAEVFGWDGDLEALAKLLNTGPFVGQECQIVTEEEEYRGKTSVKIKWLNRADGGGTMPAETVQALVARLKERARKAAASVNEDAAPRPAPAPRPAAVPNGADPLDAPEEDEIPF